ncbi:MAG: FAD-dependent oxidoreductase [Proteobacteria bacterium]|nr:FAD-dependent oxidoreductase [Pseudomonadota bacterium]
MAEALETWRVHGIELAIGESEQRVRERALAAAGIGADALRGFRIAKKSLDARRIGGTRRLRFVVHADLVLPAGFASAGLARAQRAGRVVRAPERGQIEVERVHASLRGKRVAVLGAGPAGLFAALVLARNGIAVDLVDRGDALRERGRALTAFDRTRVADPESNLLFGEGGAGTYSDGKLYTRSHKRGPLRDVLEILALHGAPSSILVDARPHIGSNKLPKVITAVRERLVAAGVRFEFGARVVGLRTTAAGVRRRVQGVRLEDGRELGADAVVVATGHSARDVFELLLDAGVRVEAKPFALGVRIEHPQSLVNRIQYGAHADHPRLPNAAYSLVQPVDGRGVFSFCMCPGGWIVPATTEPDGLVVNGMSLSRRDSPFANSGLVVAVEVEDWERAGFRGPLGGVALQRVIERAAMQAGGGAMRAPATRASDFVRGRGSTTVPESSYVPGLTAGSVGEVLGAAGIDFSARLVHMGSRREHAS